MAGSSGQISGGALNHPAMFVSLNVLGSMVLDVNGTRLDAKFIDNTGAVARLLHDPEGIGRADHHHDDASRRDGQCRVLEPGERDGRNISVHLGDCLGSTAGGAWD